MTESFLVLLAAAVRIELDRRGEFKRVRLGFQFSTFCSTRPMIGVEVDCGLQFAPALGDLGLEAQLLFLE